jgi:hypothetical protein
MPHKKEINVIMKVATKKIFISKRFLCLFRFLPIVFAFCVQKLPNFTMFKIDQSNFAGLGPQKYITN